MLEVASCKAAAHCRNLQPIPAGQAQFTPPGSTPWNYHSNAMQRNPAGAVLVPQKPPSAQCFSRSDHFELGRDPSLRSRTSAPMAISPIAAKGRHDTKTHRATFAAPTAVSMDSRPEAFATIPT